MVKGIFMEATASGRVIQAETRRSGGTYVIEVRQLPKRNEDFFFDIGRFWVYTAALTDLPPGRHRVRVRHRGDDDLREASADGGFAVALDTVVTVP